MSTLEFIAALSVVFVSVSVQASTGFGLALVGAPFLLLIDTRLVPVSLLMAGLVSGIAVFLRERSSLEPGCVVPITLGRPVGLIGSVMLLKVLSERSLSILLACLVMVAVALSIAGLRIRATRPNYVTAGAASSFGATIGGIGGPPVALTIQDLPGPALRTTAAAVGTIGVLASLATLPIASEASVDEFSLGLALLPASALGFWASGHMRRFVDRGNTARTVVWIVSVAGSLMVLARELL